MGREESSIVGASLLPLAVLLLVRAGGAAESTAVDSAVWSVVVVLVSWTALAARRSGLRGGERAAYVAVSAVSGCALVVLKALLH